MTLRIPLIASVAVALLTLTASPAAAHAGALVVPGAQRCYVFETHLTTEYWVETNGIATGGLPQGTGTTNHPLDDLGLLGTWRGVLGDSGLQRTAGDHDGDGRIDPADTRIADPVAWALRCASA